MKTPQNIDARRVGYARVSTDDQHLELQRDALAKAGCVEIYEDTASGKHTARPGLARCLSALRPGDTLIVWRLDRLGRSLADLSRIVNGLREKGIDFQSLSENIETQSAAGKLFFHIFASLAEYERELIRERTFAGLAAARRRGHVGGRKKALDNKALKEIEALLRDPAVSVADIARRYGVTRRTLYNSVDVVGIRAGKL